MQRRGLRKYMLHTLRNGGEIMKRITRRFLSLLMAIAMIGIMTACGTSGNGGNTAATDGIAADGEASAADGESSGPAEAAEG